jgi:hypothetical protein
MNHKHLRKRQVITHLHGIIPQTLQHSRLHIFFHYPYTQFKDLKLFIFNANIKDAHISFYRCVQVFAYTVSVPIIIRIYFKIKFYNKYFSLKNNNYSSQFEKFNTIIETKTFIFNTGRKFKFYYNRSHVLEIYCEDSLTIKPEIISIERRRHISMSYNVLSNYACIISIEFS